jgi:hypothetical protein
VLGPTNIARYMCSTLGVSTCTAVAGPGDGCRKCANTAAHDSPLLGAPCLYRPGQRQTAHQQQILTPAQQTLSQSPERTTAHSVELLFQHLATQTRIDSTAGLNMVILARLPAMCVSSCSHNIAVPVSRRQVAASHTACQPLSHSPTALPWPTPGK